jgi:hypothetical protein
MNERLQGRCNSQKKNVISVEYRHQGIMEHNIATVLDQKYPIFNYHFIVFRVGGNDPIIHNNRA